MLSSINILLIEDDSMHAVLIKRSLEKSKTRYNIDIADSLGKAHGIIKRQKPDIALVDWMLPDGKGIDLLSSYPDADFPVIIMTSHGSEKIAVDAIKAGAFDYISKSADMFAEMPHIIERSLRQWSHICDKRMAQQALAKSEKKFKKILENIEDVYFELDSEGQILDIGNSVKNTTGYSPDQLIGKSFSTLFVSEDNFTALIQQVLTSDKSSGYDAQFKDINSNILACSISAFTSSDNENNSLRIVGAFRNITDQRTMLRALRESEERFRGIFEHSYDGIAIINTAGKVIGWNKALKDILNTSKEDAIGQYYWDIYSKNCLSGEDPKPEAEALKSLIINAIHGNDIEWLNTINEYEVKSPGGKSKHISVVMFPIPSEHGNYLCGIYRDITESKNVETELINARNKAEVGSKLKTTILANLSHELRTPLTGILGFASILMKVVEDPDTLEMVELIQKSGDRLLQTINSILALSELEANRINVNLEDIHLASLVKTVLFTFEDMCQEKNIYIKADIKDEYIYATLDEYFLNQILFNLIDNAVKFTFEGGVTIETSSEITDGKVIAVIKVSDTGLGIAAENLTHITSEFRQGTEGRDRSQEGIGLGLTLTYKMLSVMNGEMVIKSVVDKGTTVTMKFAGKQFDGQEVYSS